MTGVALPLSGGRHRKLIPGAVALGRAAEDSCIPSGLSLSHLFKINAKKIENLHMPFVQSSGILLRRKKKKKKEKLKVYSKRNLKSGFLKCLILFVMIGEKCRETIFFFFIVSIKTGKTPNE